MIKTMLGRSSLSGVCVGVIEPSPPLWIIAVPSQVLVSGTVFPKAFGKDLLASEQELSLAPLLMPDAHLVPSAYLVPGAYLVPLTIWTII